MDIRGFFGNPSTANTSSVYMTLIDVQTRTHNLYGSVTTMNPEQIERAIDGIVGSAREMVRRRQAENITSNAVNPGLTILQRLNLIRDRVQPGSPLVTPPPMRPVSPLGPPPPMRTTPQIVPVRLPAELRPAARAPFTQEQVVGILRGPLPPRAPRAPRPAQPVDWALPKRSSRMKKLKVITQVEINTEIDCGVCFESHTKDKILTTECKHQYCITCWATWMQNTQSNKSCPTCRTVCPPVTYYKVRAATTRRAPVTA